MRPSLRALELGANRLITRKGGQELLKLMAAQEDMLWLGADGTMVSEYFASRLRAHGERRRARLPAGQRERWEHVLWLLRPRRGESCPVGAVAATLSEIAAADRAAAALAAAAPPPSPAAAESPKCHPSPRGRAAAPAAPPPAPEHPPPRPQPIPPHPPCGGGSGLAQLHPAAAAAAPELIPLQGGSSPSMVPLAPRPPAPGGSTPSAPPSRHAAALRNSGSGSVPAPQHGRCAAGAGASRESPGRDSLSLSDSGCRVSGAGSEELPSPQHASAGWRGDDLRRARCERPLSSLSGYSALLPHSCVSEAAAETDLPSDAEGLPGASQLPTPQPPREPRCAPASARPAAAEPPAPALPPPSAEAPPGSPKFVRATLNEAYDEEWAADEAPAGGPTTLEVRCPVRDLPDATPAQSGESGLPGEPATRRIYSDNPDFTEEGMLAKGRGRFCVTHDDAHHHLVFGYSTPSAYSHLLREVDPQVGELFEFIDAYQPATITIDTPFKFPGRIDYVPAVLGGPDSFLQPDPPAPLPPCTAVRPPPASAPAREAGDKEGQGMYWSFVTTSNSALAYEHRRRRTAAVQRGNPNDNPEAALAKLQSQIYLANIAPPAGYPAAATHGGAASAAQAPAAAGAASKQDAAPPPEVLNDGLHVLEDSRCFGGHGGCYDHCRAASEALRRRRSSYCGGDGGGAEPEATLSYGRVAGRVTEWHVAPEPGATWGVIEAADGRSAAVYPGALAAELHQQAHIRTLRRGVALCVGDKVNFIAAPCARPPHSWQALDVRRGSGRLPRADSGGKPRQRQQPTFAEQQFWRIEQYLERKRLHINTLLPLVRHSPQHPPPAPAPVQSFFLHRVVQPTPAGLSSRSARLTSGALNHSGTRLATGSYDLTAKVWDGDTGELLHTLQGHEGYVYDVIWNSPFCDRLVTASFDRTCKVWDATNGKCLHTLAGHDLEVVCIAVNRQSTLIASGSMDETLIVWNALSGAQVALLTGHTAEIVCADFAPCGERVVSGSADETIRVWHALTGECLAVLSGHAGEVAAVKFNAHGNLLLSCSSDTTCRLWDVATRRHKALKGHSKEVSDCEFSSDGWLVASASEDQSARVWDTLTGGCTAMMIGHEAGVCCVSFCANNTELLTGSADKTCRRWRVDTGVCLQVLTGHRGVVISSYSEDGDVILTISKDNTCRLWRRDPPNHQLLDYVAAYVSGAPALRDEIQGLPAQIRQRINVIESRQDCRLPSVTQPSPLLSRSDAACGPDAWPHAQGSGPAAAPAEGAGAAAAEAAPPPAGGSPTAVQAPAEAPSADPSAPLATSPLPSRPSPTGITSPDIADLLCGGSAFSGEGAEDDYEDGDEDEEGDDADESAPLASPLPSGSHGSPGPHA
eukprot:TRINITY_DN887_c0_g2_i1.p1 TRINITY_DN887_c0_g2~~TRINITY_DN887_c0_g2_i1.p1  ORF type:complete len:1514 (+),score=462.77 TRINITY_DN887_c0_g2_i1:423-4544(+)